MKILKEFLILAFFSWLGTTLTTITKLPIPGSVVGLLLFFLTLHFNVIKLEAVEHVGHWFQSTMAFFFVPLTVALMTYMGLLGKYWFEIMIVLLMGTLLTFIISALVTEKVGKTHE